MFALYILCGSAAAFFLSVFRAIYSDLTSPLRHVPGPFWARYTRLWYLLSVYRGHAERDNILLHRKYARPGEHHARIVRLGPNMFSIASPDKAVYGVGSKMPKSSWYEGWKHPSPDRWTLFPDRDIKRHAETRKKFQGLYAMSSLKGYEAYVDECAEIFEQRLREAADDGGVIDMARFFQYYAFDVIGDITYSKRFGFLDACKDVAGLIKALDASMLYSTLAGVYAWIHPYTYKISEMLPGSGAGGRTYVMGFVRERVSERRAQREVWEAEGKGVEAKEAMPGDFLDRLLDAEAEGSKGVTAYHVFMMGLSNIIAGSDTTAVSLSGILYYLLRTPLALQKLKAEIVQAEQVGVWDGVKIGFTESQEMPYLQACIKEGLRLHSAVGLPLWRVIPSSGAEVCGQWFPEGTEVGINIWVAHYDEDVWGPDANSFRPERWLEGAKEGSEKLKRMESYYMPVR